MKYLLILLLFTAMGYSQTISKQVIGSAGSTQSNSDFKISWTTGEPIVGLMSAGGNQLGNGYYPALDLKTLKIEDKDLELQIKVYPNPTSKMLYISHPELNSFSITITEMNGKQIYSGLIMKESALDISNYVQGIYFVTIENKETNKKNTYKIIKK